jgi:hypothetical protein
MNYLEKLLKGVELNGKGWGNGELSRGVLVQRKFAENAGIYPVYSSQLRITDK